MRVASGLSQADIGRHVGATVAAVSRWERGLRVPHGAAAIRYGQLIAQLTEGQELTMADPAAADLQGQHPTPIATEAGPS
jgi:DNA-binding transcriptional regulator YiaG